MGFQGIDEIMEALIALPDGLDARLAAPRAGEEATELGQGSHALAERGGPEAGGGDAAWDHWCATPGVHTRRRKAHQDRRDQPG